MRPDPHYREAGFALIETLVSATILIAIALATLAAVDRTQHAALETTSRSVAAALAEQDQEKMRALPATTLSNYHPAPRSVRQGRSTYSVTSRVEWVRDDTGGTPSCTSDSRQADYLRLTSTVTSPTVGPDIGPVTLSSLAAAPLGAFGARQGTLAVKITDGRNQPVAGLPVAITGPTAMADTTNAAGCAIFAYITAGTYQVLLNQAGWVDPSGTTAVDATKIVNAGSVSLQSLQYARAGKITVSYDTLVAGVSKPSRGWAATAANSKVPGSGLRPMVGTLNAVSPGINRPQPNVEIPNLFPFDTGYGTFSGECAGANPVAAIPDANWFAPTGNGADDNVILAPGDATAATTVRQPALNITVNNGTAALPGAHIVLTPRDATCTVKPVLTTDASGRATKPAFNFGGSVGSVAYDPGVPFGSYDVCIDGLIGTTRKKYTSLTRLTVNDRNGTAAQTIQLDTALGTGACPE